MNHWFEQHRSAMGRLDRFADVAARVSGSNVSFLVAAAIVLGWAMLGPHYDYSDTWQLVINTGTTIVTFLMVFLCTNAVNRQADRDRHQSEENARVTMEAEQRIEALQQELARIENDKLDKIIAHLGIG